MDYFNTPLSDIPATLWLLARCACGHGKAEAIWQVRDRLGGRHSPSRLQERLTCKKCGRRGAVVTVVHERECGTLVPGAPNTYNQIGRNQQ